MPKFSSRIAERFYGVDGADEDAGDVNEFGRWHGRFNCRRAVVILVEDSQGFVDAWVAPHQEANPMWDGILSEVSEFYHAGDAGDAE